LTVTKIVRQTIPCGRRCNCKRAVCQTSLCSGNHVVSPCSRSKTTVSAGNTEFRHRYAFYTPDVLRITVSNTYATEGPLITPAARTNYQNKNSSRVLCRNMSVSVHYQPSSKSLKFRRFKSDRDEVWQDSLSSKYASNDGVGFLI